MSDKQEREPFEPLTFEDFDAARAVLKDVLLGYEGDDPHLAAEFDAVHHKADHLCGCNPDWHTVESWASPESYSFCGHHTDKDRWHAFALGVRAATREQANQVTTHDAETPKASIENPSQYNPEDSA